MKAQQSTASMVLVALSLALIGCSTRSAGPTQQASWTRLVLLSREGCANTETMRTRVNDALRSMQRVEDVQVLDQDSLPQSDVRRGYPTPTLLFADSDVFGLDVPKPPLPDPT